jgi:hypothetical protein
MVAETYSTVGRSLPLTLLDVWEKYRERSGPDCGDGVFVKYCCSFQRGMRDLANFQSSVQEPICLSLLGAIMLRTGWATDPAILSSPCLVVRA